MKRQSTGRMAFRVSKGGNTLASVHEVDEREMVEMVVKHRYGVRCSAIDGTRKAIYVDGGRSVRSLSVSTQFRQPEPLDATVSAIPTHLKNR